MFHPSRTVFVSVALLLLAIVSLHVIAAQATQTTLQTTTTVQTDPKTSKLKLAPNQTAIYFKDLHCKHCAKKVARKVFTVKGVVRVKTDLKTDIAIVTAQAKKKLDPVALWSAAQKAGFPVLRLVGPDGTFEPDPKTKSARRVPDRRTTATKNGALGTSASRGPTSPKL